MKEKMPEMPKTPVAAWRRRAAMAGYLFLLPNAIGFLIFTSLPVLASMVLSAFDWNLINPPKWVGLGNFQKLIVDADFWKYVGNTVFLMMGIPLSIFLSLFLAVVLNQKLKGMVFFRTLLFIPSITAGIGTMLLWMWIFNPEFGALNTFLGSIYDVLAWLPGKLGWVWTAWDKIRPEWLGDPNWSKPSLILMGLWGSMGGFNMILYLAALQGVPPELYEAAKIDGAGAWQRFWKITWPMVSPTTFFIFVMGIIGGFKGGFQTAHIMTNGGPSGSTTTISYYIFNNAYQWFNMGYAASIAWLLFIIVLAMTLFNWYFSQRFVHYG